MSTEVKEFAIVKSIMKLLKLDDAGKISKFFNQEVKSAKEAKDKTNIKIQNSLVGRAKTAGGFVWKYKY